VFDDWFADVVDWLELERLDVRKPLALGSVGCLLSESAKLWYRQYKEKNPEESWNLHKCILILRSKLVGSIAPDKLWKQYEGFNMKQLGNDTTIT